MRRAVALVLLLAACDRGPFTAPRPLGGRVYSAAELNRGFQVYRRNCRACHGELGDGHGISAQGLWPPPRDLRQGLYKFGRAPAPELPPDAELARIVRGGLGGTAMLPWSIDDRDLDALLGYVKSLSPRWQAEKAGASITPSPDPYAPRGEEGRRAAITRGEALYHGTALCSTCHPAYVTHERLHEITKALGAPVTSFAPDMYASRIKETEFCWRWQPSAAGQEPICAEPVRDIPPDFTHDRLRAIRPSTALPDLFLTLAAGINGAGMPPWRGVLPDDDLWAIAYYVRSLVDLRGTPAADSLRSRLTSPSNLDWKPPSSP